MELILGLIGGLTAGILVLVVEHRLSLPRARSNDALASALRDWLSAVQVNVNAQSQPGLSPESAAELNLTSSADMGAAERVMLVLGPRALRDALLDFERSGKNMADPRGQDALIRILTVVRSVTVPHLDPIEDSVLREHLFQQPR